MVRHGLRAFPGDPCGPGLRPATSTVASRQTVADKVGARHRPWPMVYIGTIAPSGSGRRMPSARAAGDSVRPSTKVNVHHFGGALSCCALSCCSLRFLCNLSMNSQYSLFCSSGRQGIFSSLNIGFCKSALRSSSENFTSEFFSIMSMAHCLAGATPSFGSARSIPNAISTR
jgi:hypothetical protein